MSVSGERATRIDASKSLISLKRYSEDSAAGNWALIKASGLV